MEHPQRPSCTQSSAACTPTHPPAFLLVRLLPLPLPLPHPNPSCTSGNSGNNSERAPGDIQGQRPQAACRKESPTNGEVQPFLLTWKIPTLCTIWMKRKRSALSLCLLGRWADGVGQGSGPARSGGKAPRNSWACRVAYTSPKHKAAPAPSLASAPSHSSAGVVRVPWVVHPCTAQAPRLAGAAWPS